MMPDQVSLASSRRCAFNQSRSEIDASLVNEYCCAGRLRYIVVFNSDR